MSGLPQTGGCLLYTSLATAIVLPILAYLGLQWSDMTSWAALAGILVQAVKNPVILVSALVSVWGIINDPTTAGLSDSKKAMGYTAPKKED